MINYRSYRKKKSFIPAIIIILLAVFLSFSAFRDLFGLRTLAQTAVYPFQFAAAALYKGIIAVPAKLVNLRNLSIENAELKQELKTLKPRLLLYKGRAGENQRLRSALFFRNQGRAKFNLLAAQVVGKSPTPWFSILEINQGSSAGVRVDMPVIVAEGLVGRVIETALFSAKVMLLTDAASSVAAADERSRDFGVVAGGGSASKLFMKYVSAGGDVAVDDVIATSRISLIFPSGIPIGSVSHAAKGEHDLFYHIEIKPAVDFSKLEEVFIIL